MPKKTPNQKTAKTPAHVAVIMDGNGRWAARRGLPRVMGHRQGAQAVRRVIEAAADLGVQYITLFGFSSENWGRPAPEVQELMGLLRTYLRSNTAELHENDIRMKVIGDRRAFDPDIVALIENAERLTADNTRLTVIIALNYGGRLDIAQAVHRLTADWFVAGRKPDLKEVEERFAGFLMTAGIPDPDILIRTSGEQRISNFLLWQCAYTELVFTETLWPDFDREDLEAALVEYGRRDRRFGALSHSQTTTAKT
ncbi:MAG: di-trans,poly-cis-decaprenylcistransferase [Alphaproteobacteria bacterium]|nr:di-trans,poly-cis-decaprenylcistransferase [Alphaproteobacteria bacterium]